MAEAEIKNIVRLMNVDMEGKIDVERSLRRIKGVGHMYSRSVCKKSGIDRKRKIGSLNPDEIKLLEETVSSTFPSWMLNRKKDPETGEDKHLTNIALDLQKREDINQLRKMKTYRGTRHEQGLPCRGQRTRGSFRRNKTVGVSKKKAMEAKKGGKKK